MSMIVRYCDRCGEKIKFAPKEIHVPSKIIDADVDLGRLSNEEDETTRCFDLCKPCYKKINTMLVKLIEDKEAGIMEGDDFRSV